MIKWLRFPFCYQVLPLLANAGQTAASVLVARQADPIVTRFTTVFDPADSSRTRTADSGYEIRVDVKNGVWGFCETKNPNQCDMGDTCVDDTTCSTGCGVGPKGLRTWSCPHGRFCSTALLTLSNSPTVFANLGCGDKPSVTDHYNAFTTAPRPSTTSTPPAPKPSPKHTSQATTSPTTSSSQTAPSSTSSITSPSSTSTSNPSDSTSTPSPQTPTTSNEGPLNSISPSPPNNTPAIIGAVVGCVALICLSVVAVVLIRRRHAAVAAAAAAAAGAAATTATIPGAAEVGSGGGGAGGGVPPHGAAAGYVKPPMELPAGGPPVYEELPARGPEVYRELPAGGQEVYNVEVIDSPVVGRGSLREMA